MPIEEGEEPPAFGDLARNDVPGTLAIYRWYKARGETVPEDLQEVLYLLHDDTDALFDALAKLYAKLPRVSSLGDDETRLGL